MAERAVVFDKSKYHLQSVRDHGLPDHQAAVHIGLFFGWAVDRGLVLPWVEDGAPEAFARYRRREITGPALIAKLDGVLMDDQFTDLGLAFVASYYDQYLGDYGRTLIEGRPSVFHVEDDAPNAARLAAVLDARYDAWLRTRDPSLGRPDLRADPAVSDGLPSTLILPVVPVTSGVVLPNGPLGIRAGRPESVRGVDAAWAGDRRVWLVALKGVRKGKPPEAADLLDIGVVAEIRSVTAVPDRPGSKDVVLACLARAELRRWVDRAALVAEVDVRPEPEPTEEDIGLLEEVRLLVVDVVTRRKEMGRPTDLLGLAAAQSGAALLDVVARELPSAREELLTVLEAPDLRTRAEVVLDMLRRE